MQYALPLFLLELAESSTKRNSILTTQYLNHKYATTVTLEYRRKKYNKNYGIDQSSVRVKMENQTSRRKVLLKNKKGC